MGYSQKINDPAFDNYLRKSRKWKFQFSLIIAAIAIAGFYLYGAFSDEMDNPEALRIGLVIGTLFLAIGLLSAKSSNSASWDGLVIDKKIRKTEKYTVYTVYIKSQAGKVYERRYENDATVYNYYKIGDRVRFHGKLNTYEKFDKSCDDIIFCNACAFLHDIDEDVCLNCGCPLLK